MNKTFTVAEQQTTPNKPSDPAIVSRVIASGSFILKTAAHFGGGQGDGADLVLGRGADGSLLIPGSSLAGASRSYLAHYFIGSTAFGYLSALPFDEVALHKQESLNSSGFDLTVLTTLFGAVGSDGEQSALRFKDAYAINDEVKIEIRDGVAIDSRTGQVRHDLTREKDKGDAGSKYDLEVIPTQTTFKFEFELVLRVGDDYTALKSALNILLRAFEQGEIRLGAKTRRGLGCGTVKDWQILELDFSNPADVLNWLYRTKSTTSLEAFEQSRKLPIYKNQQVYFNLEADFALVSSVLVRSYRPSLYSQSKDVDAIHLESGGRAILPGTSLAGVIRHRAERIAYTLTDDPKKAKGLVEQLFGWVDRNTKVQQASRLRIEEAYLNEELVSTAIQTRLSVDRFTGGAREGFLFEEEPLWATNSEQAIIQTPIWSLQCRLWLGILDQIEQAQIGLLLLVLKDMWTGDLTVGGQAGIGRGVMRGLKAELSLVNSQAQKPIHWQIISAATESNKNTLYLVGSDFEQLEGYVIALRNYLKE